MAETTSVHSKLENAGAAWLQAALNQTPEFTPSEGAFGFYAGSRTAQFILPCAVASVAESEEVEVPGAGIYRAKLKFVVMTSQDEPVASSDNADDLHTSRVELLQNYLQDTEAMKTQLGERGNLRVFGFVITGAASDTQGRMLVDAIDADVYCQAQ